MEAEAELAVIGGSGLYRFLTPARTLDVSTPYGEPSSGVSIVDIDGRKVAFLARHGVRHTVPPHAINYRANVHALHSMGATRIVAPAAVGSLRREMAPGDVVVCDQFIDRTWGRASTFFDGPEVAHVSLADPYCEQLRPLAVTAARDAGFTAHESGTVVVTQGPRFGTRAESAHYRAIGADVLSMTQYPEVALARELSMCYANVSLVTDYDVGLDEVAEARPVTQADVMHALDKSVERLRDCLVRLIAAVTVERRCRCAEGAARPLRPAPPPPR
jgi:5'-methylthioadenosine phosphorylase